MAVQNQINKEPDALEIFRPKKKEHDKKDLSTYFPKDEIFNKKKTFLSKKNKGTADERELVADWRKLFIGGSHIILFKGHALSVTEIKLFDEEAKKAYLTKK